MPRTFDAIVLGLGAMGSAALRALARRGLAVLGLDRFAPPHALGSSHGLSRIIREAYFEDPVYVPLVQRAYLLWDELAREAGERLLLRTGGLMIGPANGVLVQGALRSAREHRLDHERLDAAAIARRVPAFRPDASMVGVWEPRAGVLFPEACVRAFLATARRHGAAIHAGEPATSWRPAGSGFQVETTGGRYQAARLVIAAGAWIDRLVPELKGALAVERVVQLWFEPCADRAAFHSARCPISIWEHEPGRFFYAFPELGPGVKAAAHHEGRVSDPDAIDRVVHAGDEAPVRRLLARYMPGAAGPLAASAVCFYTNTADEHFLIDRHPEHAGVLVVSACSGHGFKFAPVVGEIASDLLVEGWTRHDVSRFGWRSAGAGHAAKGSP